MTTAVPNKLVSKTARKSLRRLAPSGPDEIPALLMRMAIEPYSLLKNLAAWAMEESSAMSMTKGETSSWAMVGSSSLSCLIAVTALSLSRAPMRTWNLPVCESCWAMEKPMPLLAPVMTTLGLVDLEVNIVKGGGEGGGGVAKGLKMKLFRVCRLEVWSEETRMLRV